MDAFTRNNKTGRMIGMGTFFVVGGNKDMAALCAVIYFNDFDGFHIYKFYILHCTFSSLGFDLVVTFNT